MNKPIVITAGEPAGIGPDLVIKLAQSPSTVPWVVMADPALLAERAQALGSIIRIKPYSTGQIIEPAQATEIYVSAQHKLATPSLPGVLNPHNSAYVLDTLRAASEGCVRGDYSAIVTGPVHKGIINDAGMPFSGHTEFFAEHTNTPYVVMLLTARSLHVALVTTHLPLRNVADAITADLLEQTIRILHQDLQLKFGLSDPKILVCGLNPHAGEQGHLGREEITIIAPTLKKLRAQNIQLIGPLPADTVFTPNTLRQGDAVLAMYHDQGLTALKQHGFGEAVNVTLGLLYIRTSVDHGTALDLAGTGRVSAGSLRAAFTLATSMRDAIHHDG